MKYQLLNLLFKLNSTDVFRKYSEYLIKSQNKLSANLDFQEQKLINILVHASKYVPYYRSIFADINLVKNQKVNLSNFYKIPILTKKIISENFKDLISQDPNFTQRKAYINHSGGSTGSPVEIMQDKHYWTTSMAGKWLFYSFITSYPCTHLKLWGSEKEINGKKSYISSLKSWLLNQKNVNAFLMSKYSIEEYIKTINTFRPKIVEGYVQPLVELSQFAIKHEMNIASPVGVISSAGTLYPHMQETIEKAFKCKTYNRYGSREVGDIASSCSHQSGLHINIFDQYLEILDSNLQPSSKIDKVYITTLNNFSMPLIRYDIGDYAQLSDSKCECGYGLPLLRKVEGREMSVLKTREGSVIPAEFFIHFIGVVHNKGWIEKFQVIQNDFELVTIKYVSNKTDISQFKLDVDRSIKKVMGQKCQIVWNQVSDIPSLPNGKYLYVINKLNE